MTKITAQRLSDIARAVGAQLNESVRLLQESESEAQFLAYRDVVGQIMGRIYCDIMAPHYEEHPDILPDEIRGDDE